MCGFMHKHTKFIKLSKSDRQTTMRPKTERKWYRWFRYRWWRNSIDLKCFHVIVSIFKGFWLIFDQNRQGNLDHNGRTDGLTDQCTDSASNFFSCNITLALMNWLIFHQNQSGKLTLPNGWTDRQTDGRTDGRPHPLLDMRGRFKKYFQSLYIIFPVSTVNICNIYYVSGGPKIMWKDVTMSWTNCDVSTFWIIFAAFVCGKDRVKIKAKAHVRLSEINLGRRSNTDLDLTTSLSN